MTGVYERKREGGGGGREGGGREGGGEGGGGGGGGGGEGGGGGGGWEVTFRGRGLDCVCFGQCVCCVTHILTYTVCGKRLPSSA